MSEARFKTMRHIETVRNFMNSMIIELITRQEHHDQSKLEEPEVSIFEEYTPKLRDCTYDSDEYNVYLKEMKVALAHHYSKNRHHPEHFGTGINEMTLIDLIEMICDWKASGMRHNDGDIFQSIEKNKIRFGISDQLESILVATAIWMEKQKVFNKANES
jgi:hypothetical protein